MSGFRFRKIRSRLLTIVMAGALLGMGSLTLVYLSTSITLLETKRNHQVETQLAILATNISAAVIFEDEKSAHELLSSLQVDGDFLSISVTKYDSEFQATELFQAARKYTWEQIPVVFSGEAFTIPVILDGDAIGELSAYVSDASLLAQVTSTIEQAILVFLVISSVIYLLSLRLQKSITDPVQALNQISRKVTEEGDYSLRAPVMSHDEVGELAADFNRMLDQIEQRDLMLEKTVQQRTAELEKLADEFRHRAFHDALTGLPNRALLAERIGSVVAHARRVNFPFGLFLIDLDNFKNINDTLGHDVGDELLKIIAERLLGTMRDEDIICRLGGDEFLIVAEELKCATAADRIAHKLLRALSEPIVVNNKRLDVTMSIGGALYPDHGTDLTSLKRAADIAMYAAKEAGKNQYKLFHGEMEKTTQHRLMVQNDLRDAVKDGDIRLYFQPQIDAVSGSVYGCEVLVRWRHKKHGLLAPDVFIPYAEESGLIQLVDYFVLEQACKQAKVWIDQGKPLVVSINLSGLHFRDRSILDRLRSALDTYQLPPEYLGIELTEAVLISDSDVAMSVVADIKAMGLKISLDDFGVGYSSLNYLRTLPFDVVKLDKSFINGILTNPQDQRLTEGIMKLAQGLNLKVVAEGVESQAQMEYLVGIHCRLMQGYFFLPPRACEDFEQWRAQWQPARVTRDKIMPFPGRR